MPQARAGLSAFLFCLLIPAAMPVGAGDLSEAARIKIRLEQDIRFDVQKAPFNHVERFRLENYMFPQSIGAEQDVLSFESTHEDYATRETEGRQYLSYDFDSQSLKTHNAIRNTFVIQSQVTRVPLARKIAYPAASTAPALQPYLDFNDEIDIDEGLYEQARLLAEGADDGFVLTMEVARWVQQAIDYDLSSLQTPTQVSATQAYRTGRGVCQDITNVFISMLRGLGIPARAVYGFAYTDTAALGARFASSWGTHAWAEVWLGDRWVPFDLAYRQYGWVDATHIVIAKEAAIRHTLMRISAVGVGLTLGESDQKSRIKVLESVPGQPRKRFELNLEGRHDAREGVLSLRIKNLSAYYQAYGLSFIKAADVQWHDTPVLTLALAPFEERLIERRFRLPELSAGFVYTFPFQARIAGQVSEYALSARHKKQ